VVFDLDPGQGADILSCARVALILHDLLSRLRLESCVKTSGQKGLHVYVPLNRPTTTFDDTKTFSKAVALILQKTYPELVTAKMAKEQRTGRVFINWEQNDASKTMICVYSLRARDEPFVSFPLSWTDLERLVSEGNSRTPHVGHGEALKRVTKTGDLFRLMLTQVQELPHL
jgi:bifunctional non-homologous end joining protein LigD